jgi:hypothetical protein
VLRKLASYSVRAIELAGVMQREPEQIVDQHEERPTIGITRASWWNYKKKSTEAPESSSPVVLIQQEWVHESHSKKKEIGSRVCGSQY